MLRTLASTPWCLPALEKPVQAPRVLWRFWIRKRSTGNKYGLHKNHSISHSVFAVSLFFFLSFFFSLSLPHFLSLCLSLSLSLSFSLSLSLSLPCCVLLSGSLVLCLSWSRQTKTTPENKFGSSISPNAEEGRFCSFKICLLNWQMYMKQNNPLSDLFCPPSHCFAMTYFFLFKSALSVAGWVAFQLFSSLLLLVFTSLMEATPTSVSSHLNCVLSFKLFCPFRVSTFGRTLLICWFSRQKKCMKYGLLTKTGVQRCLGQRWVLLSRKWQTSSYRFEKNAFDEPFTETT